MDELYKRELTAEEICVLASFMKYETVIGVSDKDVSALNIDLRASVKSAVKNLELKRFIDFSLDGKLYLKNSPASLIEVLCRPESFLTVKCSNRDSVTVARKNDCNVLLGRTERNTYTADIIDSFDFLDGFIQKTAETEDFHEAVKLDDIRFIQEKINSFDNKKALSELKNCLKNENFAGYISDILFGNCGYAKVQIYKQDKRFYRNIYNAFFIFCSGRIFKVKIDEGKTVFFDSIKSDDVKSEVINNFKNSEDLIGE